MSLELLSQKRSGFSVFLLAGHFVKHQEISSSQNVVDVVFLDRVGANCAVVVDETIDSLLDEVEVGPITSA